MIKKIKTPKKKYLLKVQEVITFGCIFCILETSRLGQEGFEGPTNYQEYEDYSSAYDRYQQNDYFMPAGAFSLQDDMFINFLQYIQIIKA